MNTILEQIKSGYYYFMNNEIEFGTLATLKSTKKVTSKLGNITDFDIKKLKNIRNDTCSYKGIIDISIESC